MTAQSEDGYLGTHTRVRPLTGDMQDKQKVTLYLPPELHRQLKIRAAVDSEPMSAIAEQAIGFYLSHSEVVEGVVEGMEASQWGSTHQVYTCPECTHSVTLRSGEMVSIKPQPGVLAEEESATPAGNLEVGSEELVPARV